MSDALLKEAIAEARQVKAAAIANAKLSLEEAFKPHLSSMLTAKLRNEMEDATKNDAHGTEDGGETDKKAVVEKVNPSSSAIGTTDNKQPSSDGRTSSNVPNPKQEVDAFGKGDSGADQTIGGSNPAPQGSDAHPEKLHEDDLGLDDEEEDDELGGNGGDEFGGDAEMGAGLGGGDAEMGGEFGADTDLDGGEDEFGGMGGGGDETLDLDAIIRELEADVLGAINGQPEEVAAPQGMAPQAMMAQEDLSATAAKDSVEQTKDMEPHLSPEGEGQTLKLGETTKEEVDEEIDLDEILREMDVQDQGTNPHHYAKVEELQTEIANLKRNLKEHRNVVRFLKDRINEINMLNAKLLFTNKIFKGFNLNGSQKMHVVETFDRATTLREVKLIYSTLAEAYTGKTKAGKQATALTEGLASRPAGSTKPKSQVLNEDTDVVKERFKKLAGLLKS